MALKDFFNSALGYVDKGAESINQISKGDISGITQSVAWIRFLWWAKLIIWFLVITIIVVLIYHFFFRFNKKVLFKRLKGRAIIDNFSDRGRIITDERKKTKLIFLRTRGSCPIPPYTYTSKMGKQDFYELYINEKGDIYPINDEPFINQVTNEIKSNKQIDFHMLSAWRLEEMKLAEDKFKRKSFLQQHMPEILVFMGMIICATIVWITMKSIEKVGIENAVAMKEIAQALTSLK